MAVDVYTKVRWQIEDLDEQELTPQEYVWEILRIMGEYGLFGDFYWSCKTGMIGGLG